jgi:hypothetical protein
VLYSGSGLPELLMIRIFMYGVFVFVLLRFSAVGFVAFRSLVPGDVSWRQVLPCAVENEHASKYVLTNAFIFSKTPSHLAP